MRTPYTWILQIAAVLLLALSPAMALAGDDFEQNDPTPTPDEDDLVQEDHPDQLVAEKENGELQEAGPNWDMFDACTKDSYTYATVCYVAESDELWVWDAQKDGLGAIGYWYADLDDDGDTDRAPDREGSCWNPHGATSWAVCDLDFDEAGVPLSFQAGCTDYDASQSPDQPRSSNDFPCEGTTDTIETVT